MTDQELLEFAAKAAGYIIVSFDKIGEEDTLYADIGDKYWNPLIDDGDALRLAVKLRLDVNQYKGTKEVVVRSWSDGGIAWQSIERWGDDQLSATRRAIIRAAAEIGKEVR